MSAFEKAPDSSENEREEVQQNGQHDEAQVAPFVTKIGAVTVTHTKPSSEPPANFDYLCQPCENPPVTECQDGVSDDSADEDEEKEEKIPPVERNITPKDVATITDDDEFIYIVGTQGNKVTRLHNLENMTKLKVSGLKMNMRLQRNEFLPKVLLFSIFSIVFFSPIVLIQDLTCRSCLIGSMDGLVENHSTLTKLELYDNHVQKFTNLEYLKNLVILDMSYNAIRDMKPVEVSIKIAGNL